MKLYWRFKRGGKWTWAPATLSPKGIPVPIQVESSNSQDLEDSQ